MSTATTTLDEIVSIHNEGIAHLEQHQYDQAAKLFTDALHQIRTILSSLNEEDHTREQDLGEGRRGEGGTDETMMTMMIMEQPVPLDCSFPSRMHHASKTTVAAEHKRSRSIQTAAHDGRARVTRLLPTNKIGNLDFDHDRETTTVLPFFQQAYKLCRNHNQYPTLISLTCMYNLALTHHMRWYYSEEESHSKTQTTSHCCSSTEQDLDRTMKLYELSYSLLSEFDHNGLCRTMILAIINNLALVHGARHDLDKQRCCFDHLVSVVMYFQQYEGCNNSSSKNEKVDTSIPVPILRSLSRLVLKHAQTPPAA